MGGFGPAFRVLIAGILSFQTKVHRSKSSLIASLYADMLTGLAGPKCVMSLAAPQRPEAGHTTTVSDNYNYEDVTGLTEYNNAD